MFSVALIVSLLGLIGSFARADYRLVYLKWGSENDSYCMEKYWNYDEAVNNWLHKHAHTKILYDYCDNTQMLLAHSNSGRIGTVLGRTNLRKPWQWSNDPRLTRGFQTENQIFNKVHVLASHTPDNEQGRGVRIEKVSTDEEESRRAYEELQSPCKVLFSCKNVVHAPVHCRAGVYAPRHIFLLQTICRKVGPESAVNEVEHIVQAIDEGQLFCQAYMSCIVSWVRSEDSGFRTADCKDRNLAQKLFNHLPDSYTKMAYDRNTGELIAKHSSGPNLEQQEWLEWATRTLNTVFPMGTWARSSKHAKSWFDIKKRKHVLSANLANAPKEKEWHFDLRSNWYNAGYLAEGDG